MVEETHSREGTGTAITAKEFRTQKQRWVAGDLRPLQGLDLKGHHTSYEGNDI
jgi:hypothetical protein